MTTSMAKLLYWSPRVLCALLAGFVSLFAFDVLDEGRSGAAVPDRIAVLYELALQARDTNQ